MRYKEAISKFENNILYYLEATGETKKIYAEKLSEALFEIFYSTYNSQTAFLFETRRMENSQVNPVIAIPLMHKGEIGFSSVPGKDGVRTFVISFTPNIANVFSAEEITSQVLYALCAYFTNFMNQRVKGALYTIYSDNNIDPASSDLAQLISPLYFAYSLSVPLLRPTDEFETYPLLDLLFFYSVRSYNAYVSSYAKLCKDHLTIVKGRRFDPAMGENVNFDMVESTTLVNEKLINRMKLVDKKYAQIVGDHANDGTLEKELDAIYNMSGVQVRLKDIIARQISHTLFNESGVLVNESFNNTTPSEFRYRMDKIIVASKFIDAEDDRTAVLSNIYSLRNKLLKEKSKEEVKLEIENRSKKDNLSTIAKINHLSALDDELNTLQRKVVDADVRPKKYGVFIEYPAGYNY
jgi:hypothetical protein